MKMILTKNNPVYKALEAVVLFMFGFLIKLLTYAVLALIYVAYVLTYLIIFGIYILLICIFIYGISFIMSFVLPF